MLNHPGYCIALDQGTFSSRATVYDSHGQVVESYQQAIPLHRIDQNQVEQNAEEILASILTVLNIATNNYKDNGAILIAGLATQRSSILAWRPSNGKAISPVLSWQDTRAHQWLDSFQSHAVMVQSITKLRLSPHYGVSKIHWLSENLDEVKKAIKENDCVISPIASYLLFHLSKEKNYSIDSANSSRMLLQNMNTKSWDSQLLNLFSIDKNLLPAISPISSHYGTIKNSAIKICAMNGDQNAALYQKGQPDPFSLRINLGTGAFVLTPISEEVLSSNLFNNSGLLGGISNSHNQSTDFYIEGTVNGAGAAIAWLKEQYPLINFPENLNQINFGQIAPPIFINTVGGLGAPYWRSDIEPEFINHEPSEHNLQQTMLAVLESIIFLLMINIERIRDLKTEIHYIEISGGLSQINILCQSLSDLSQLVVRKSGGTEATSKGIAWLAWSHYLQHSPDWAAPLTTEGWLPQINTSLHSRYLQFKQQLSAMTESS